MDISTTIATMRATATVIAVHDRIGRDVAQQTADEGLTSAILTPEQLAAITAAGLTGADMAAMRAFLVALSALLDANNGTHRKTLAKWRTTY